MHVLFFIIESISIFIVSLQNLALEEHVTSNNLMVNCQHEKRNTLFLGLLLLRNFSIFEVFSLFLSTGA